MKTVIEIRKILASLARQRPVFHSEADFQHALAWEIHQQLPAASIRLELPLSIGGRTLHLDIWAATEEAVFAIELKYKTRNLEVQRGEEKFRLRNQSAQDIGRYDFIKDIWRLEQIVEGRENAVGYAVLLTNESTYWAGESRRPTIDSDFRLYEGRILEGTLQWGEEASAGTKRGRENPLPLRGRYPLNWQEYSRIDDRRHGAFRYLVVEVPNAGKSGGRQ